MKDLKEKNKNDLMKILREKQEALRAFRFGIAGRKGRNVREGRAIRKEIARIQTELSSRNK